MARSPDRFTPTATVPAQPALTTIAKPHAAPSSPSMSGVQAKDSVGPLAGNPLFLAALPMSGTEGSSVLSNFAGGNVVANFTDSDGNHNPALYSVTIAWGDGQSSAADGIKYIGRPFAVTGSHAYAEEGTYAFTVTLTDSDGASATSSATATIADAALTAGASLALDAAPGVALTATVANFTDADPAGTVSDYTATITWGDGHTSPGTITANNQGGFSVTGTNTYAQSGLYNYSVAIQDTGGSKTTATGTVAVVAITLTLPNGTYVPINADNDNGSPLLTTGIPITRDYNSTKVLTTDDPEIKPVNVAVTPAGALPGTFTFSHPESGTGDISLWTDAEKTNSITSTTTFTSATLPKTIFVEGRKPTTASQGPGGTFHSP